MRRRSYTSYTASERKLRRLKAVNRFLRVSSLALITGLFVEIGFLSLTSPRLQVTGTMVNGEGVSQTVQRIIVAKGDQLIGSNLFLADTESIESAVLKHPTVESVTVSRRLPDTLNVNVLMRKPFISVSYKGVCYVLDKHLIPFEKQPYPEAGTSVIHVAKAAKPEMGKPWKSAYITSGIRALNAAQNRSLKVSRVSIDQAGNMCLNIDSGIRIMAGGPLEMDKKLWVAARFLASGVVNQSSIDYIDVSCPTAPAYRPKGETSASAIP